MGPIAGFCKVQAAVPARGQLVPLLQPTERAVAVLLMQMQTKPEGVPWPRLGSPQRVHGKRPPTTNAADLASCRKRIGEGARALRKVSTLTVAYTNDMLRAAIPCARGEEIEEDAAIAVARSLLHMMT